MRLVGRSALLLIAGFCGGCWNNPAPPTHEAAAFAWRADIATDAPSPLYRFELTPELVQLHRNGAPGVAVLDATGARLTCGAAGHASNDPVFMLRHDLAASVREDGDLARCGDAIPTCIAGKTCRVPDECPRKTIDVAGTALDDATRPEDILDALHVEPSPPDCRPESSDSARDCTTADASAIARYHRERQRREDARRLVERYDIKYTGRYPPPPQTLSIVPTGGGAIASGPTRSGKRGAMGGALVGQFNPGDGRPVDTSPPKIVEPPLNAEVDGATWLVTLEGDVPKNDLFMLELTWNLPPPIAYPKAALVTFDARGEVKRDGFGISPDNDKYAPGAAIVQTVPARASSRYIRVATPEATPGLHLVSARGSFFTPKPFVGDTHDAWYWFEPSDHPPFHLGLDARNGDCTASIFGAKAQSLPQLAQADWPPQVRLGAPEQGASGAAEAVAHDQTLSAWVRWARYVLGTWIAALAVTAARWAWLARVASPRRSDRSTRTTR